MSAFRAGMKVRYKHGKGLTTGKIKEISGDRATVITKNGKSTVTRPLSNLQRDSE